jgi:hypothetical protein
MSTSCPLLRNWPHTSASRSHATQVWYSVRSPAPPPRYSLVATTKFVNAAVRLTSYPVKDGESDIGNRGASNYSTEECKALLAAIGGPAVELIENPAVRPVLSLRITGQGGSEFLVAYPQDALIEGGHAGTI